MPFETEHRRDSDLFEDLSRKVLASGHQVRFQAQGRSMFPLIRDGETLRVESVAAEKLRVGDIVVAKTVHGVRAHRLILADAKRDCFLTRGDTAQESDPPICASAILGRVVLSPVAHLRHRFHSFRQRIIHSGMRWRRILATLALLVVFGSASLSAQVVFDSVTSSSQNTAGAGAHTFNFAHTTTAAANRLLVVGVSINTVNTAATVTGITYNALPLTRLGFHNDAGATRRVEIWYLIAPASGAQTVGVTYTLPAAVRVGVVAGAMTFSGVDQTGPLSAMVSNDGAGGTFSQLDIPSGTNQVVFETVAIDRGLTVTSGTSQTQRWSINTNGGGGVAGNVRGAGSTNAGAASVPMSETFSAATNWSVAGASVKPLQADVGVTINPGGAVPFGTNLTYTISVTNNGPTTATGVSLTDTLAAGLTLISATPTQGSCSGTGPVTCPLGSLAGGATATVTVTASATQSGSYANTATVTRTEPDLNAGNNSYTAVGIVQSNACAAPGVLGPGGTLGGVVNTYYPATASVTAGTANTTIPVGTARGALATIAAGDLLLVMQMQDASINSTNTSSYGNGATGAGFTAINNAGNYEFVKATGPIGGGAIPISGSGLNSGLIYSYTIAAATGTKGKSTYQVIRVPQYSTATLSSTLTALAWDGTSGGVLALDIAGALTLGTATVTVNGLGFRGAAGLALNGGGGGANTDYVHASPATYTGAVAAGVDGGKGEGVAGTPRWVATATAPFFLDTTVDGYPAGGMARGAPANAGGGGTDGDQAINQENAGGGGGSNGGSGGAGGNSWQSTLGIGGLGGAPFPSTLGRIGMGGGGGAGSRNNTPGDNQASSGAAGGGIIFIRAGSLSGTATLTANGTNAYGLTLNDSGGGGGAGGTIVVLSAGGGEGGLTIQSRGGNGGNAWSTQTFTLGDRHGPGGGGGGGAVYLTAAASISVTGGANGITLNPGAAYGATSGAAGVAVTNAQIRDGSGTQSGAGCIPDVTINKTHTGSLVRGTSVPYQIVVSNLSPYGSTTGLVTVIDNFPLGVVPTTATGTGWTCSVSAQTVSCVRADALAPGAAYPAITINATVGQNAPATVVNTATVSGGGEIDLANDTAIDVASVGSVSDLVMSNAGAPNPVAAGANITYTQIIANSGPSDATGVTLVETIPANTTLLTITPPAGWVCSNPGPTGTLVCSVADMPAGTATLTLVVRVNPGTPNGTVITDTVRASSAVADPNAANNTATVNTIVGATAQADLSVSNIAAPNPVTPTSNITYTQIVANTGSSAATTATYSDAVPLNTNFQGLIAPAGWTCSTPAIGATGTVSCTNPSVAAGSTGTFQLQVQVNLGVGAGTVITDTVTVGAANDANAGNNSATATDLVATAGQSDLALSTSTSPTGVVLAGNNLTYTQSITNNGPAAATTVAFLQATPLNTTFQAVSAPAGWTCTTPAVGATGNVSCTNPSLTAGSVANISVIVNVNAATANGTNITATSSVSSATSDPSAANNSTTVVTQVAARVNLSVTSTGAPSPVAAAANITYTQSVINRGPSNATTVSFTQATPNNTTFQPSIFPLGWACVTPPVNGTGNITCTIATLPPGATANFQVVVRVNAGTAAGTIITDTATVASATHDTVPGDNQVIVRIAVGVAGQADLRITNVGAPDPVLAGNNITYTQVATNGGPSNATAAVFSETTPPNTTFVSLPTPAGWACPTLPPVGGTGNISCNIVTFNNAAAATFVLTVKVNTGTPFGTLINDSASITALTADPNPTNNSASSSIAVGTSADLSLTSADSPDPVIAANNITYTQVLTNPGPSNAANVTFTETIPANTNFQSFTPPLGWTCNTLVVGGTGTLTCTIASLAPGTTNFPFAVQVNPGTPSGTTITNTVSVTSSTDTSTGNNTATTTTIVATGTQADLAMTNTSAAPTVTAGSNITYTQTVTNNGPAAANTLTLTETIPLNTTFQSIVQGTWACITPPVNSTGTVTCTRATLNAATSAPITLVVQVNAGTPSGTVIGDTASVSAVTGDPALANNSASANVTVGTGTNADVSITKTAAPSPVAQGNLLTYTLVVTNNGPASATNVTVVDVLPAVLKFVSVVTTTGTCSQAANTVTCLVGTLANAATATINIVTTPQSSTIVTNSATVTADQGDSSSGNNTASITTLVEAPTRIQLLSLTAEGTSQGAIIRWNTGGEFNNLGFNVYRERNGERVRLNSTLVAGSALMMSGYLEKHAGKSYAWIDPKGTPTSSYWLEDLDLNGERTLHGPISVSVTGSSSAAVSSAMFSEVAAAQARGSASHIVESSQRPAPVTQAQIDQQFDLAAHPAVKMMVNHEGWYRVTQPDLVAAGLSANPDPRNLRLFAEAIEQPMLVTGADAGVFGPTAALEFYATGMDTPFTGTRVYWLVAGNHPGLRVNSSGDLPGGTNYPQQFTETVELRERTTYFAALINTNDNNFFGALVSSTPIDQILDTPHVSTATNPSPRLEVVLQGVGDSVPHDVSVALNGATVGHVTFTGQSQGKLRVDLPPGTLLDSNTISLSAEDGDSDISLVDHITFSYQRRFAVTGDRLKFSARAGVPVQIAGFQETSVRVFDITSAVQPVELATRLVSGGDGSYTAQVQVPLTPSGRHTLFALAAGQIEKPVQLVANQPSQWHSPQAGSQVVVLTHPAFAGEVAPLADLRRQQGRTVSVVLTDDVYDEFSFGEHTPQAIRDFLKTATQNWTTKPKYLLLTGDASVDPRSFLGFGDFDFVPTRVIPTTQLMTASDDWFSDFNNSGLPTLATGRLPVRTADEAQTVVAKIVGYETGNNSGNWTGQALFVADRNDNNEDFTADTQKIAALLPSSIQATQILVTNLDPATARAEVQTALNSGELLVNYLGHGSVEVWSGDNLLNTTSGAALTNGSRLPVFLTFDCLNGFFHDVYTQSLAETLLLNGQGGAVAIVTSSGLTDAPPQVLLDRSLVRALFQNGGTTLGDALLQAKSTVKVKDVRRTYLLFGDPLLRLKAPFN